MRDARDGFSILAVWHLGRASVTLAGLIPCNCRGQGPVYPREVLLPLPCGASLRPRISRQAADVEQHDTSGVTRTSTENRWGGGTDAIRSAARFLNWW